MDESSGPEFKHSLVGEVLRVGLFLFVLVLVGLAAYTPWFGLMGDDWWFFTQLSSGQYLDVQIYEIPSRPVMAYLWQGLWRAFGLRVWAYYLVYFAIQWLASVVVFVMLRSVFHWNLIEAAVAAAFSLLYPADTTHVYLATLGARLSTLLALIGVFLWFWAWMHPYSSFLLQGVGFGVMILSLLAYETPWFVFALLPLVLPSIAYRSPRAWLRYSLTCHAVLATYMVFRLWVMNAVSQRPVPYYVSLRLTPDWILSQILELPGAILWKGWLYMLRTMLVAWGMGSCVMLIVCTGLLMATLEWLRRSANWVPRDQRASLRLVGIGLLLSVAAVMPVVFSSASFENAVGTLDGRYAHGAALGHAVLLTGLCALPGCLLRLGSVGRRLITVTLVAVLLAVAALGNLGLQREYATVWRAQLHVLRDLHEHARCLRSGTVIVLLDVPAGAYDVRYSYPLTQLVRRFYADPSLHVLPWQRGFPSEEQLLAFGSESIAALECTQKSITLFDYRDVVALSLEQGEHWQVVDMIDSRYLCSETSGGPLFSWPLSWEPARGPIKLGHPEPHCTPRALPATSWQRFLLSQLDFADRVDLP